MSRLEEVENTDKAREKIDRARSQILAILDRLDYAQSLPDEVIELPAGQRIRC